MSQPPGRFDDPEWKDLVRFARFQLCKQRHILFWDPVWDHYSDEQIVIEYYAVLMDLDDRYLQEFEALIVKSKGGVDADILWMERKMEELRKEREEAAAKAEEFEETLETMGKK